MKIVKLSKKYSIDDEGNLYCNGIIVPKRKKRTYLRIDDNVQQLAFWIAKEFVDGYFEGAVVDHIDSDPTNNHPSNLQWITQSQNIQKRIDFEETDSKYIKECYKSRGVDKVTKQDVMRELVWKHRHNGKFRFEIEDEDDVSEVLDEFFEVKPIVSKK